MKWSYRPSKIFRTGVSWALFVGTVPLPASLEKAEGGRPSSSVVLNKEFQKMQLGCGKMYFSYTSINGMGHLTEIQAIPY